MMCNEFVEHVLSVKINMIIIFEGSFVGLSSERYLLCSWNLLKGLMAVQKL